MSGSEKATLYYQNQAIRYTIRRSTRRRTVGITIDVQGVRVAAPKRMPLEQVVALVNTKARWIAEKYADFKRRSGPRKRFVSGEEFLYLGRRVSLQIQSDPGARPKRGRTQLGPSAQPELFDFDFSRTRPKAAVALKGKVLHVQANASSMQSTKEVREILERWYRARAEEVIVRRVQHYADQLGWPMPKVLIRNQKKRWGSCNAKGELRFNWRLVMLPLPVLDYVVVHEMAHLKVLNHSPRFWALVEQIMPNYKARHQALHELGMGLYW
ncbi:MAG: M48 family metallopeptidase [Meiothermus sp.]|uniref:M48 family metallopeptidase n=1 Tax=Meiothermus sp. TaxID=1955249 RepID=UPI0025F9ACAD|nr:SprT family zinc-dependent metalloprotease [Meiothermus sp.]MCS7069379.1 M48 family metallopeptidase [Meiothermus sp.]MCX7601827.1 M48 family metallopeptidase [Meiothermus sp.]MDW8424302.1 SprT family zinc-dependent metalloprotease [Meiothermus sp.]